MAELPRHLHVGGQESDNETFYPADYVFRFSNRDRLYDCPSRVLPLPTPSLLASWRWWVLLELLSDLLAGAR